MTSCLWFCQPLLLNNEWYLGQEISILRQFVKSLSICSPLSDIIEQIISQQCLVSLVLIWSTCTHLFFLRPKLKCSIHIQVYPLLLIEIFILNRIILFEFTTLMLFLLQQHQGRIGLPPMDDDDVLLRVDFVREVDALLQEVRAEQGNIQSPQGLDPESVATRLKQQEKEQTIHQVEALLELAISLKW